MLPAFRYDKKRSKKQYHKIIMQENGRTIDVLTLINAIANSFKVHNP